MAVEGSALFLPGAASASCASCHKEAAKYRCPACGTASCSVGCVKAHKQATGCTGKRKRTDFVPLSEFNDDNLVSGVLTFPRAFHGSLECVWNVYLSCMSLDVLLMT